MTRVDTPAPRRSSLLKVLLLLLIGVLAGANGVYYMMTRGRIAAPVVPPAATAATAPTASPTAPPASTIGTAPRVAPAPS